MAATKFTEAQREKLFAQLEAPFDPALIKWRVMHTFDYGRSGVILPFADPRAYTDRLNDLFTPSAGRASTRSRPCHRFAAWSGASPSSRARCWWQPP